MRAAALLGASLLALSGSLLEAEVRALSINSKQAPPDVEVVVGEVEYKVNPPIPDVNDLATEGNERAGEALSAAAEVHAAEAKRMAEEAALYSHKKMRQIVNSAATASETVREGQEDAFKALKAAEHAEADALEIKKLFHNVDNVVNAAADRAIAEVIAEKRARMNKEATRVKKQIAAQKKKLETAAAESAQDAAYPFQQAKIKAEKNVVDYLLRARELAAATTMIKNESVKVANIGVGLQGKGLLIPAQQKMMQAHDLMDKANQLQGQATGFNKIANSINGEMGLYDLAAGGASNYAAYGQNPGGPDFSLPDLPAGIKYA